MNNDQFEQLSPAGGQALLEHLPERIRDAYLARATELGFQVENVIEMALAGYLDAEAIGFVDCKPDRGKKKAA
jgi:hypothetical protein